ncbi:MAG: hypothetical protein KGJ32_02010 [Xanthomonadaceae bacterium]|nr:hypothetical protein [Xanthomonadaceae bacterium]
MPLVLATLLASSVAAAADAPNLAAYAVDMPKCQAAQVKLYAAIEAETKPPCENAVDPQPGIECMQRSADLAQQAKQACIQALADVDPVQAAIVAAGP